MATWEELKDLGNAAFKEKRFTEAAEHFSAAIALNADAHVLYSNRSGAYASLGKWREALTDAESCISRKADWAKGYSRKGAALEGLGDETAAKKAYEEGLALDPENATLKAALSAIASRGRSAKPGVPVPVGKMMMQLNYVIVAFTFVYMFPFTPARIGFYLYRFVLLSAAVKHGRALLAKHGGFSLSLLSKAKELRADENWHYVALCMILVLWKPVPFVVLPIAAYAAGTILPTLDRSVADKLPSALQSFVRPKLEFMLTNEGQQAVCAFASTVRGPGGGVARACSRRCRPCRRRARRSTSALRSARRSASAPGAATPHPAPNTRLAHLCAPAPLPPYARVASLCCRRR